MPATDSTGQQVRLTRWAAPDASVQASRVDGAEATEMHLCLRPRPDGDLASQAAQIYRDLDRVLGEQGAGRGDVLSERVFCRDLDRLESGLLPARQAFYGAVEGGGPLRTYLGQPPCRPGLALEMQVRVVFASAPQHNVRFHAVGGDLGAGLARRISYGGLDQLCVHNITGGEPGDGMDYAAQMESVFARTEALLKEQDLGFGDVVRTWIYLPHMERDYAALNRVRNDFFDRIGLRRPPASTGIEAGVYPADRIGSIDLYALSGTAPYALDLLHASGLNEAWSYGSAFARGMAVRRRDRTALCISGTASIDDDGQVVAVGDIAGQVERMLDNVEELLAGARATPADLVRVTTYLKRAEFLDAFEAAWRRRGYPDDVPHSVVRADVCRPEWLCETEMAAVVGPR